MSFRIFRFGLLVLALALSSPVLAREEIRAVVAEVALRVDGSVAVTETLEVTAEGDQIRRGIFRDIPTVLTNPDGSLLRSDLDVRSVTRNGRPEPFTLEAISSGQRIRIGSADVLLEPGPHRYVISYTMTRMARRFADHDELYWNATGNFWAFPIANARASITLPAGAVIAQIAGYTGAQGATETAVDINRTSDTTATIRTTRALAPREGLTVAVSFQKGILAEPDAAQNAAWWLSDHRGVVLPLLAVVLVLAYYLFAWRAVGRDPAKGVIIPLFHPPKGFSPALVHYIHAMGWKNSGWTAFTAAMIDLGVKGLLRFDKQGKTTRVIATGAQPHEALPIGEKVIFDFFAGRGTTTLDKTSGTQVLATRDKFLRVLESENRLVYFRRNRGYVVAGFAGSAVALVGLVLLGALAPLWLPVGFFAGIVLGVGTAVFRSVWSGPGLLRIIIGIWVAVFAANLVGSASSLLFEIPIDAGFVAAISIVAINIVFAVLMRAPTVQGRKVMDQVEGLRMYLQTAEQERLNLAGEPEMTVSRFEAILPYAIALGVEKPWAEHFQAELSRHAVAETGASYSPGWYHSSAGSAFSSRSFARDVAAIGTGLSAAMVASQPQASSSSGFSGGSGGGGFSGGGGGGGGGGGW